MSAVRDCTVRSVPAPELKRILYSSRIISLQDLADALRADTASVLDMAEIFLTAGDVECLCPIGTDEARPELVYYRWREETDDDYLWQRDLAVPPRLRPCHLDVAIAILE